MKYNSIYIFFYLKEIKYRFFFCSLSFFLTFLITTIYSFEYLYIFIGPFSRIFIFTEMGEMIQISLKISLGISFLFFFPHVIYNYFSFVSPSLLKSKQIEFYQKLFFYNFFFFIGLYWAASSIQFLFNFLSAFEIKSLIYTIAWEIRIDSYFRFFTYYLFIISLMILLFFFCYCILVSEKNIYQQNNPYLILLLRKKNKKNCWFFFLLFGAAVAPAEFISQLIISSGLYLYFEFIFFIVFIFYKYKKFMNLSKN